MRAVFLDSPRQFQVISRPDPIPDDDIAIIKVYRTGICATDIATIEGLSTVAKYPLTPGHEFIGSIEYAPSGCGYSPDDWVTIYPTQGCGSCPACVAGMPNYCTDFRVLGVHRDGGSFAERVAIPVSQLMRVPDALANEDGALIEPLAVGVHANRRAATRSGHRVAIIGAGTVGTMIAQVARARGVTNILLADRLGARRDLCRELGFSYFAHVHGDILPAHLTSAGGPLDIVFDTACTRQTLSAAVQSLTPGGILVLLGFPHGSEDIALPYAKAYKWELSILLSRNYMRDDFTDSIALLEQGHVNCKRMITGTWPLEEFALAYSALRQHPDQHVKVLLAP